MPCFANLSAEALAKAEASLDRSWAVPQRLRRA